MYHYDSLQASLQSCENSLSVSMVTLQMVQHCKSSSHWCKFREAARIVGALQSRLWFLFFWEMIQPPWPTTRRTWDNTSLTVLNQAFLLLFQQQKRTLREGLQMWNWTFSYKYASHLFLSTCTLRTLCWLPTWIYLCVHTPYNTDHLHCLPNLHCLSPIVL